MAKRRAQMQTPIEDGQRLGVDLEVYAEVEGMSPLFDDMLPAFITGRR